MLFLRDKEFQIQCNSVSPKPFLDLAIPFL